MLVDQRLFMRKYFNLKTKPQSRLKYKQKKGKITDTFFVVICYLKKIFPQNFFCNFVLITIFIFNLKSILKN